MSDHGRLDQRLNRHLQIKRDDSFGDLLGLLGMFDPEAAVILSDQIGVSQAGAAAPSDLVPITETGYRSTLRRRTVLPPTSKHGWKPSQDPDWRCNEQERSQFTLLKPNIFTLRKIKLSFPVFHYFLYNSLRC